MNLSQRLRKVTLDKQEWQRLYYKNQQEYIRRRLSAEQQQQLKRMILTERPSKYGIEREIWTGKIIAAVIREEWGVELKTSRI
jgi:transposase